MDNKHKSVITDEKIVLYGHYKKVISIFFAVIAGLSLMGLLLAGSVKNTIVNPQYYKQIFIKANTYEELLEKGIPSLVMHATLSEDAITNTLAKKGIVWVIKNSIPASWIEEKTELLIDDISKYISDSKENPKIVVALNDANDHLVQIVDGLNMLEQILPSCSQAETISQETKGLFNVNIDCAKMTFSLDDIKTQIEKTKLAIEQVETADVDITNQVQKVTDAFTGINKFAHKISNLYWFFWIILIVSFVIIVILQIKNVYKLIEYIVISTASGSLIVLLAAIITRSSTINALEKNISIQTTPEMQNIIFNILQTSIIDRYQSITMNSAILLTVSLIVLIITILIARKNHTK